MAESKNGRPAEAAERVEPTGRRVPDIDRLDRSVPEDRRSKPDRPNARPDPRGDPAAGQERQATAAPLTVLVGGSESEAAAQTPRAPAPPPKPRIGDTRPAPVRRPPPAASGSLVTPSVAANGVRPEPVAPTHDLETEPFTAPAVIETALEDSSGTDEATAPTTPRRTSRGRRRAARERRGKSLGRYSMYVHVRPHATQIAILEGRTLVEHYVSRTSDEVSQIDGNIYSGRVQNVLPGMEAAFVDIGVPKNAVLYRGDVRYDRHDLDQASAASSQPRIEDVLRPGQSIVVQVTKNPIGAKGARLTQEVSLPGRFAVLVPNSSAFGISKRLGDNERRRLRRIIDQVKPPGHGLIVRTAAEGASADELRRDVNTLLERWAAIEAAARASDRPRLLYREPDLAVRILREELSPEYRAVTIDDPVLYEEVRSYVNEVSPDLADRVEFYDTSVEPLPIFDRYHVHEQLHKALDRKVWLPSGGSLIIERTEALTVIDVNTGKNVGRTNLEETVYRNNLEAAEEVARQLRLRDIGGIIVIDFIDMEVKENRERVSAALRAALARDKTRTQVLDISELGVVEMTRKRVSEGLIESLSTVCEVCNGRGIVLDRSLL